MRAILLILVFTSVSCGAARAESDRNMFNTLVNIINQSDTILAASVRTADPVTVDGEKFVRAQAEVREVFKPAAGVDKAIAYDVVFANKETPQTTIDKTYILLLRKGKDGKEAGRYFLVDLSSPIGVPEERKDAYFQLVRDYVAAAQAAPEKHALEPHLLKVMHCGIPFFQEDAAKTSLLLPDWKPDQIAKVVDILGGAGRAAPPNGNERDNLVALVIGQGDRTQATAQGRRELLAGNADAVYYGLTRRMAPDTDGILQDFLKDDERRARLGAIRVAGLLRKTEILDNFEHQNAERIDGETLTALAEARKLVKRD